MAGSSRRPCVKLALWASVAFAATTIELIYGRLVVMTCKTASEALSALISVGARSTDIIAFVRQLSLLAQADIATSGY